MVVSTLAPSKTASRADTARGGRSRPGGQPERRRQVGLVPAQDRDGRKRRAAGWTPDVETGVSGSAVGGDHSRNRVPGTDPRPRRACVGEDRSSGGVGERDRARLSVDPMVLGFPASVGGRPVASSVRFRIELDVARARAHRPSITPTEPAYTPSPLDPLRGSYTCCWGRLVRHAREVRLGASTRPVPTRPTQVWPWGRPLYCLYLTCRGRAPRPRLPTGPRTDVAMASTPDVTSWHLPLHRSGRALRRRARPRVATCLQLPRGTSTPRRSPHG